VRLFGIAMALSCAACAWTSGVDSKLPAAALERAQLSRAGEGFRARRVEPFVVLSNGSPELLDDAERTVLSIREMLRQDPFFDHEPPPTSIWLYPHWGAFVSGLASLGMPLVDTPFYSVMARATLQEKAYYTDRTREIFTYASGRESGRDTLVHEMVHAYVRADHANVPSWMNEGLATLFERVELDDRGRLRLEVAPIVTLRLVLALERGAIPSFRELARAGYWAFHRGGDESTNYRLSAHVLELLERRGVLRHFYREYWTRNAARDPDGVLLLADLLEIDVADLDDVIRRSIVESWEGYVDGPRRRARERPWH
jgi:hypothetical protein